MKKGDSMRLIVGLGNPGKEYENTRHNIGFIMIDEIARSLNVTIKQEKFNGSFAKVNYKDDQLILLKPQKYMNLSGEIVKKYVDYFKIPIENILIISDDLDMPVGKIKLKLFGSPGGHNGLKNIEQHLKTSHYKRIKVGISNDKKMDTKDYVLGNLSMEDKNKIDEIKNIFPKIFEDYMNYPFDYVMSKYNKK